MTKLRDIAHCRAGDKGDQSILVLIPYDRRDLDRAAFAVTPASIREELELPQGVTPRIEVLTHLGAIVITLPGLLSGGVTRSGWADPHGKTIAGQLLNLTMGES